MNRCVAWVVVGLGLILAFLLGDRVPAPSIGTKVIFLGPGMGHVAYTIGFVGGLLDDPALRNAVISRNVSFGGASSGAHAAAYAVASLHNVMNMREWYMRDMRAGYEAVGRHSTLVMGAELEAAGYRYYDTCNEKLDGNIPWLGRFVMSFTEALTFRPRFLTSFSTRSEIAQASMASSYVPGLMGFRPWGMFLNGFPVFDGYLGLLRTDFPDSYMYVSFLPTVPHFLLRNKHYLSVSHYDSTNESFVTKVIPWGCPTWADVAFERGWKDAASHLEDLRQAIMNFLDA